MRRATTVVNAIPTSFDVKTLILLFPVSTGMAFFRAVPMKWMELLSSHNAPSFQMVLSCKIQTTSFIQGGAEEMRSYNFSVPDQSGTYWYHSHLSTQYCDGLRYAALYSLSIECYVYITNSGPLVIYGMLN